MPFDFVVGVLMVTDQAVPVPWKDRSIENERRASVFFSNHSMRVIDIGQMRAR